MHSPKPTGSFSLGDGVTEADRVFARVLVRHVSAFRAASGLSSLKMQFVLPSGALLKVLDAEGFARTHVEKRAPPKEEPLDKGEPSNLAHYHIPVLFSAFIPYPHCPVDSGLTMTLTALTRSRIFSYSGKEAPSSGAFRRFEIGYPRQLSELDPQSPDLSKTQVQYGNTFPTWYTGAMSEVVQIVGGWGKQFGEDDAEYEEYERVRMKVPDKIVAKMKSQMAGGTMLPGYTGFPPRSGEIQFDYKFANTDAVSFDSQGFPWLVNVSPNGVVAMPLPMIPATTTDAFRQWIEEVGDTEILKILDRFKGIPSGEGFPRDREAWRRAGVIVDVLDPSEFYQYEPWATSLGFAFNRDGSAAVATCYEVAAINQGHVYQMTLRLGPAEGRGMKPPRAATQLGSDEAARLARFVRSLKERLADFNGDADAIYYKVRRHSVGELLGVIGVGDANIDYWDSLEMAPIAKHSGKLSRSGSGNLIGYILNPHYAAAYQVPAMIKGQPMSIALPYAFTFPTEESYPKCDTIVHAFYDKSDMLKWVKYFRDDTSKPAKPDEAPKCALVGEYEWRANTGAANIPSHFYTSDIDHREKVAPTYTRHKVNGEFLHASRPYVKQVAFFWVDFTVGRQQYYKIEYEVDGDVREHFRDAVAIPAGFRASYLYAQEKGKITAYKKWEKYWVPTVNANSYSFWAHDKTAAAFGSGDMTAAGLELGDNFSPAYEHPPHGIFSGTPPERLACASEIFEAGWMPSTTDVSQALQAGLGGGGKVVNIGSGGMSEDVDPPKWQSSTKVDSGGEFKDDNGFVKFAYDALPVVVDDGAHHPLYFSPEPQLLYGTQLTFGDASYTYINEGGHHYGYSAYADRRRIPRFIGVINE